MVVLPIAKKMGEQWIEKIATGLNESIISLLKGAVHDTQKEKDLLKYLKDHPREEKKLATSVRMYLEDEGTITALASTILPSPGAKIPYYHKLLIWIGYLQYQMKRDIVLKGFINGIDCLSIFKLAHYFSRDEFPKIYVSDGNDPHIYFFTGMKIFIVETASAEEQRSEFLRLNEKIKLNSIRYLEDDILKSAYEVERIHEHWVEFKGYKYNYVPILDTDSETMKFLKESYSYSFEDLPLSIRPLA
jgi:hypothetical protein